MAIVLFCGMLHVLDMKVGRKMKRHLSIGVFLSVLVLVGVAMAEIPSLSPERVAAIKGYLARQTCELPKIDGENYGVRSAIPSQVFYYGYTVAPFPKLKGFEALGNLPDQDADATKSTFLSAGLEMGTLKSWGVEIVPQLKAAGFKRARLNFAWRLIEKQKGVYDFSALDAWVQALEAAGIEPWLYGGYGNAVYYGKFKPKSKLASSFWDAPVYHGEEAVSAWLNFFRALATHYKGRVHFYEIWNELDGRWYKFGEKAEDVLGVSQASRDFAQFYRRTVEVLREVDPTAKAGISLGNLDSTWVTGLARTDFPEMLDVWTYHGYRRTVEEGVVQSLSRMKALMRRKDGSLPEIVMGESGRGVGPTLSGRFNTRTEFGQAKFAARRMFFDLAMGAKFCNLFDMGDARYGLFKTDDKKPRLAWYVIRALGSVFDGLEPAPDLGIVFSTRAPHSMASQQDYTAIERHAYRRKGIPLFAWWVPENLDIEAEPIFGLLKVYSGCDRTDNLKHPILIDTVRRTVWDVGGAVGKRPGIDVLHLAPATGYPYILTDLAIFDEYVK